MTNYNPEKQKQYFKRYYEKTGKAKIKAYYETTGKAKVLEDKLKKGIILPPETEVELDPYKEPLRKVEDGFGYMGTIAHNKEGTHVQCHICGYMYRDLSKHITTGHNIKPTEYRETYKLSRKASLIAKDMKEQMVKRSMNVSSEEKLRRICTIKAAKPREWVGAPHSLEKKNREGRCPDQLLDKIESLALKLKRTPTVRDFSKEYGSGFVSSIYTTYGTWNQAVSFAGLTPTSYQPSTARYTRESVIAMIRQFYEIEGRVPRKSDFGGNSLLPGHGTAFKLFGGIIEARRAAGFGQADYVNESEL